MSVGISQLRAFLPPPGSVPIGTDRFHALLRTDHPLAGQPSVDLAELVGDDFLLSTPAN